MLHNLVIAFTKFPGAESIHLLQGVVAGILLIRGYIKNCVSQVAIALTILIGFAIYEGYERWRIDDPADTDFQVFLITMWISGIITLIVYIANCWRRSR